MIKLLSDIPKYQNSVLLFLKFSNSKDNLEKLQRGILYMNSLNFFIDLEKDTGQKGMGDVLEATAVIHNLTQGELIDQQTGEVIPFGDVKKMTFRLNDWISQPIFCTAAISADILQVIQESDETIEVKAMFTPEQKERFSTDFGKYVLVIRAIDFIRRIKERFKEKKISYWASAVKYDDFNVNRQERIHAFIHEKVDIFFWKDISLSYQIEHRIVILDRNVKTPFICDVGDMSEFTTLMTTEEFFNQELTCTILND